MADEVQDFYERYPYPPPLETLDTYRRRWEDPHRRRVDHFPYDDLPAVGSDP